jgi:hypothetical protein
VWLSWRGGDELECELFRTTRVASRALFDAIAELAKLGFVNERGAVAGGRDEGGLKVSSLLVSLKNRHQLQCVASIQPSIVVMLRELAFRVTQIGRTCADPKSVERLSELSFELYVRAKDYEDLLAVPRTQ